MANLSFVIGIIGNVISLLMFASPIKTFKEVVKKKSTENYKGIPYITTLLSASLWTFYGVIKPGGLLVATVNGAGAALHLVYVFLFLVYAPQNIKVRSIVLAGVVNIGFFGSVVLVTLLAIRGGKMQITLIGFLCTGLTIGMYAAPLSAMRAVIRTKSVKFMPFFLSLFQFLNGGIWSAYAVLVRDLYLGIPNGIGFLLGSAQLILYLIYKNKSTSEDRREGGPAHISNNMIQMQELDNMNMKNQCIDRGNSLPKPSAIRQSQYSKKTTKTRSLSLNGVGRFIEKDVEKGLK